MRVKKWDSDTFETVTIRPDSDWSFVKKQLLCNDDLHYRLYQVMNLHANGGRKIQSKEWTFLQWNEEGDLFAVKENPKYHPDAIRKRLQRKARRVARAAVIHVRTHRRNASLTEKLLLEPDS